MTPAALDELVDAARAGDRSAFAAVFSATYRHVRLGVAVRCADAELVDEVVQEAYVVAFERLDEYESRGTFAAWVAGIARNRLARARRQRGRQESHLAVLEDLLAPEAEVPVVVDEALVGRVRHCLDTLTPAARELATWRFIERRPVQAIAGLLGRTAASVSVTIHRVRSALRQCIAREHGHG